MNTYVPRGASAVCAACRAAFSGVRAFDLHQTTSDDGTTLCVDPLHVGLRPHATYPDVWTRP